ncbi:hypothetical protein [Streptomyces sp. NPDC014656]|uniref:hypothetical protein n=1 Tax=Streptomyces sp. NPDC014656 TaxID=3364878 RepID=UPI003702F519
MGKRKKGRRHRRVNRTPRPVSRPGVGLSGQLPPQAVGGAGDAVVLPRQGDAASGWEASLFARRAEGGLGHPAQRTWNALKSARARESRVEELCEAVGFTPRTVARHLEGLAAHGLAVQEAGGGWSASQGPAGRQDRDPASAEPVA